MRWFEVETKPLQQRGRVSLVEFFGELQANSLSQIFTKWTRTGNDEYIETDLGTTKRWVFGHSAKGCYLTYPGLGKLEIIQI